jgi:hypothetical protein
MAARDTLDRQAAAAKRSVFSYRLEGIGRAGRVEPAGRRFQRGEDFPIEGYERDEGIGQKSAQSHLCQNPGLTQQALELRAALATLFDTRIEDHSDVEARQKPILPEAPAFPRHAARPVPRHRARIGADWDENGARPPPLRAQDMYSHAFTGEPAALSKDHIDLCALADLVGFRKSVPGDIASLAPRGVDQ